jgi:5,10-methylenetetrahydrofolate reductase
MPCRACVAPCLRTNLTKSRRFAGNGAMNLADKILDPAVPVRLFEVVPPEEGRSGAVDDAIEALRPLVSSVDAINLPEIHDESRPGPRTGRFVPRVEPRQFGARLRQALGVDVVANHCVVYDRDPMPWFCETRDVFGIRHLILVGGESSTIQYPGPSVLEAAELLREAARPGLLGGIAIPSRANEAERIRSKRAAGLEFFTTQVLFDPNDIVWLIQRLNGLEARVLLSFAPVSHPRDLQFLRWLGADIPKDLDRYLLLDGPSAEHLAGDNAGRREAARAACLERSIGLAQRILMEVFDNLPPDPPPLGLNVEHINRRNFGPATRMLERLEDLYVSLMAAHA